MFSWPRGILTEENSINITADKPISTYIDIETFRKNTCIHSTWHAFHIHDISECICCPWSSYFEFIAKLYNRVSCYIVPVSYHIMCASYRIVSASNKSCILYIVDPRFALHPIVSLILMYLIASRIHPVVSWVNPTVKWVYRNQYRMGSVYVYLFYHECVRSLYFRASLLRPILYR